MLEPSELDGLGERAIPLERLEVHGEIVDVLLFICVICELFQLLCSDTVGHVVELE